MAVTVKLDYLKNIIRDNDLTNCILRDGGKELACFECSNAEETIAQLDDALQSFEGSYIEVSVSDKTKDEKKNGAGKAGSNYKNYTYRVKLGGVGNSISGVADGGINGTILRLLNEKHTVEMQMLKVGYDNEKRFDDLRREMQALNEKKKEQPDVFEKLITQFSPLITKALGGGVEVPGNASHATSLAGDAEDLKTRLKIALQSWEKLDGDFVAVIERIVTLAANDPGKYQMAKTML